METILKFINRNYTNINKNILLDSYNLKLLRLGLSLSTLIKVLFEGPSCKFVFIIGRFLLHVCHASNHILQLLS